MKCEECRFVHREKPQANPMQLLQPELLFCRFGPPTPVAIPQRNGSVSITPIHAAVAPSHWCHQFQPLTT